MVTPRVLLQPSSFAGYGLVENGVHTLIHGHFHAWVFPVIQIVSGVIAILRDGQSGQR
jgi:hypothetical protein